MTESQSHADLSLISANTIREPLEALHQAMAEVIPMFEMGEDDARQAFAGYVQRRSEELSLSDTGKTISYSEGGTDTFISPQTPLRGGILFDKPFYLDDPTAYEAVFAALRKDYEEFRAKDFPEANAYFKAALSAVVQGQAYYFQSFIGDEKGRDDIVGDFIDDDSGSKKLLSVADLKRVAMCHERAAVVHNTLMILGITQSDLRAGYLSELRGGVEVEGGAHAFLVVTGPTGKKFILDPSHPVMIHNEEDLVAGVRLALHKVVDETAESQTVHLKGYKMLDGENGEATRIPDRELVYYFNPHHG